MRSEEVLKFLKNGGWLFDEDNCPYQRHRYTKEGRRMEWRSYINQDMMIEVCQQFYLLGKHDKEYKETNTK